MQPNSLVRLLSMRQLRSGGWSYFGSEQLSVEATTLAVMALSTESPDAARSGLDQLSHLQRRDGAWPAFGGDLDASWTTALVLCALNATGEFASAREKAFHWLLSERGREGHWFWRWKFKTVDRNVRFDPEKYGWPWASGSASWVIPTAFSVIALKQYTVCNRLEASEKRIQLGVEMLRDRACVGGGWNSGNSIVYGVPLRPHVEATAIALLALQDERRSPMIEKSLEWLILSAPNIEAVSSLAWCILCLFVYQEPVDGLKNRLATIIGDGRDMLNNATLATAILALRCGEMIHPFMVLR
jgi:squalene cyclase